MTNIKEELETMLRNHLDNEAKLTEIQMKIEEYEQRLEYAGTVYEDTDEEIIESMQLSGQSYDTIKSYTNTISDKVSNTALNYRKEEKHINKEDRAFLERKLKELENEKKYLNKVVVRIKNALMPLSVDEKFVIDNYYINKAKWNYIERKYFEEFEIHKTIKQLQTYRDNALDRMLKIINTGC